LLGTALVVKQVGVPWFRFDSGRQRLCPVSIALNPDPL